MVLQDPAKELTPHLPIPVLSQSQSNPVPVQNSSKLHWSMFMKSQPFPFPQVEGSARE